MLLTEFVHYPREYSFMSEDFLDHVGLNQQCRNKQFLTEASVIASCINITFHSITTSASNGALLSRLLAILHCLISTEALSCFKSRSLLQVYKLYTSYLWLSNHFISINPLNAYLNPICHLLALLGAHHILHISRIRVNAV